MVFVVGERSGELSNMNTIQDLYYGRISPYEMSISATPEYQKLKALTMQNEDLLRESLSEYFAVWNAPIRNEERTDPRKERTCHDVTSCS